MGKKVALVNGDIYTGRSVLSAHAVLMDGDTITGTPPANAVPADFERIDLKGNAVAPGFIDTQVNGGGGVLFNDEPTAEALQAISAAHERFGTLHFCPTIISSDPETMGQGIMAVQKAKSCNIGVLGIHLEGPFLCEKRAGIHPKKYIRTATAEEVNQILAWGQGDISIITIAPEAVDESMIRLLAASGIKVFVGHSDAAAPQVKAAFGAGAVGVTHLFNAMSQMTGREPGVVGASLSTPSAWAGIIVDGRHVDYANVQIAKACKKDRLYFVTDAMPPVGKSNAVFTIGAHTIRCVDGLCATPEGTLAGSALDMATAVRNGIERCGIAKEEALRMASTYAAEMLGLSEKYGVIRPGAYADMVILNDSMHVEGIVRKGNITIF